MIEDRLAASSLCILEEGNNDFRPFTSRRKMKTLAVCPWKVEISRLCPFNWGFWTCLYKVLFIFGASNVICSWHDIGYTEDESNFWRGIWNPKLRGRSLEISQNFFRCDLGQIKLQTRRRMWEILPKWGAMPAFACNWWVCTERASQNSQSRRRRRLQRRRSEELEYSGDIHTLVWHWYFEPQPKRGSH